MNRGIQQAVETIVPEEVYTDRKEFIDYFYKAALRAIGRRTISSVLLGRRRMGKTELFKRVVNRLFFEQDHKDPNAVVPVYYKFPDSVVSGREFALGYVENFIRWHAAFRLRDPKALRRPKDPRELFDFLKKRMSIPESFNHALSLWETIEKGGLLQPEQKAVELPREVAFWDDGSIVMFLDEFQNSHLPNDEFRVVGHMQEAVESPRCPHFVTGSAMSILADEILGKGALYGRFDFDRIEAFSDYWGAELALKAARYYGTDLPEWMAPVVSERCGGNPFYITAVVRQAVKRGQAIDGEAALNELLAIDIASGFIWGELSEQVNKWMERVNDYGVTKWVLYLAALEEGEEIDLARVQSELRLHEQVDVPIRTIKEILIKLARGDLLEYKSFGDWFGKINDPILNEFLRIWGETEIERQNRGWIKDRTIRAFETVQRRFHEYKGYLAEVFMIQILWNSQGKTLPGRCFHVDGDIILPRAFSYIDQRRRPGAGQNVEVDIYAAAGSEAWMAESKWWSDRKVGLDVVENLLAQAEIVKDREGKGLKTLRLWLFAYHGVTVDAEESMRRNGVLWSTRAELDVLLELVNLRKLPKIEEGKPKP